MKTSYAPYIEGGIPDGCFPPQARLDLGQKACCSQLSCLLYPLSSRDEAQGNIPQASFLQILSCLGVHHQAWKPSSQHAGEKRGLAGLLLGRTERAARAAELQLCAQAR